jgi:hypothetical protein
MERDWEGASRLSRRLLLSVGDVCHGHRLGKKRYLPVNFEQPCRLMPAYMDYKGGRAFSSSSLLLNITPRLPQWGQLSLACSSHQHQDLMSQRKGSQELDTDTQLQYVQLAEFEMLGKRRSQLFSQIFDTFSDF